MKKIYEDEIQIAFEDESGARITTLKKKPEHDFWGKPYLSSKLIPDSEIDKKNETCQKC